MAKEIHQLEQAIVTLQATGAGSISNNVQVACATTLDCRSGGNAAEMFMADFELLAGFGSNPTVGAQINAYLVPALDGTNYADVDATNHNMPPACLIGSFIVNKAQTAVQRMVILGVPLRPVLYTLYLDNQSGQTVTTSTWSVKCVSSQDQYNA